MKRTLLGVATVAASSTLLPGEAAAQYGAPPAPPTIPVPRNERGNAPAPGAAGPGDVLRAAACQIAQNARAGDALLATAPKSDAERSQGATFLRAAQRCLRSRDPIAATATALRAAVAEAAYENQFATPPAARTPALAAAPVPRLPASDSLSAPLAPMYGLADCATPRQPAFVRAVLATEPRSAQETAAFQALHPTFEACVPAGTQLTYDPRFTRGFLAEALLRWSAVQRDGPTSPYAAR